MKSWPLFSLILLAGQPALRGQEADAMPLHEQQGNDALASELWEVAGMHYRECLADPSLGAEAKSQIAIRLAESLVRGDNPDAALELLGQSFVAKSPDATFWKAQALAAKHRFAEAVEIFSSLLAGPAAPHRAEAGLSQASLQLALGQPDAALGTLSRLIPDADSDTMVLIQLYQVEILLDLKRTAEARNAMPDGNNVPEEDQPLATFLEAQLLLEEGEPAEAQGLFQGLLNQPDGQSLNRYHSAAIGLADAIAAQGYEEQAATSLLAFLKKESTKEQPGFPVLEPMFKRILRWLPSKPAPTDPILEGLANTVHALRNWPLRKSGEWIPPQVRPGTLPLDTAQPGAIAAWPVYSPATLTSELEALSMYAYAIGLHRAGTAETLEASHRILTLLMLDHPAHLLAKRALYQAARWALDDGNLDQAFSLLTTLRNTAKSPELVGEGAFLEALAAWQAGDPKRAGQLFDEAAAVLNAPEARSARLHSAIARLRAGDLKGFTLIQQTAATTDKSLEADIELERALATAPPASARKALEDFLGRFPDHSRAAEARIAAVEAALAGPTQDIEFARTQLAMLPEGTAVPAQRIALAKLRIADLTNDPAVAAVAQSILDTYPNDPAAKEAALTLGRVQFQAGSFNAARNVLERLAATDSNPARSQVAWLLAARSAALGGTPQSKEESLNLFKNAIAAKGPLSSVATLEMGSQLIDMSRFPEAADFLGKWLNKLPEDDPLQLPGGLLLGDALFAQGSGNPASLAEALAVYDKLLARTKNQRALFNQLQYLRGMTLELLPDEKVPSRKRETQAFEAYYSVLETTTEPAEWEYFEKCGFKALELLEKAKRWQAAIAIAQKIASFNGPRAQVAAERARKIQLDQMVW